MWRLSHKEDLMPDLPTLVIVCGLCAAAGFVDAVAGGGGLISLPAYLIAGLPVHVALGTGKLSSMLGVSVVTWKYARNGFVPWREAVVCVVVSLVASALGARAVLLVDPQVLMVALLVVLPLTAVYVLRHGFGKADAAGDESTSPEDATGQAVGVVAGEGPAPAADGVRRSSRKTMLLVALVAALMGFYDGFYGPGSGTFMLLLLTGLARLTLEESNGVCKVVTLASNFAGLVVMLAGGAVDVPLGLLSGVFLVLGSYLGARSFSQGGAKVTQPMILVVVTLFFVKVLAELI